MSKIEGQPLGKVWKTISEDDRAIVADQLRGYILQPRELRGEFYSALWDFLSKDIFFHHFLMTTRETPKYGPYNSRKKYNENLAQAFHNSRPTGSLSDADKNVAQDIVALDDDCKIFSHGDFHPYNVLVDENLKVTGIVDWQAAGFSINEWDYLEARLRSRGDQNWIQALAEIFP